MGEFEEELLDSSEAVGLGLKVAASDGIEYKTYEAEDRDLKFLVENSCMSCSRYLERHDVKIIPPQSMQERDQYVNKGIISRRYLCMPCYNKITSRTREKLKTNYYKTKTALRHTVVKSFLRGFVYGPMK